MPRSVKPKPAQDILNDSFQAVSFTQNNAVAADAQGLAALAGRRLIGFACRESAATAAVATFILRHGTGVGDPVIAPVALAANESAREWWWPGLDVPDGVFIDHVAGTFDITIFHMVAP